MLSIKNGILEIETNDLENISNGLNKQIRKFQGGSLSSLKWREKSKSKSNMITAII